MIEPTLEAQVQQLEQKVKILTRLTEISTSLNSKVHLQPLLRSIMQIAVEIVDCEAASVLLWNKNTHQLFFAASTTVDSDDASLIGKPVPMDSIAGTILRENTVVQVDDAKSDPRHYNKVDEEIDFETRSLLGVPMTYKDRVIGVLEVINKRQLPWTADDHHYLGIIAAQAAVAIEGAQLVMELRHAYQELSEMDELKNNFIALASHELRTPLGVIMGYASFLQEEESPSAKESASKVLESALKLRKIIDDLINLRYLKQKAADMHFETMPISDVMTSLERDSITLIDKDHHFDIVPPTHDVTVNIDHARIMMALTNLLNNAIAFTPAGGTILVKAECVNADEVWLRVIDRGIGIDDNQLERIFEEFYQVEDHMTRRHGGLGIGLSIVNAITQAHGGRCWAESEGEERGATFTIALPIVKNET